MEYHSYVGREWWEEQGFSDKDFVLCRQLIFLSKIPTLHDGTCRRWKLRQLYSGDELKFLGILARRTIEEGRLQLLRKSGRCRYTAVVEYCIDSVSPDNLLLLGSDFPIALTTSNNNNINNTDIMDDHNTIMVQCLGEEEKENSGKFITRQQLGGRNLLNSRDSFKGACDKEERGDVKKGHVLILPKKLEEEHGACVTLVPEATAVCQPQKICEFILENRIPFFPSIEICHLCDPPIYGGVSGNRPNGTEHRP